MNPSPNPASIIRWVTVRGGQLAISGRPKKHAQAFEKMVAEGCTHVLTLLAEKENAQEIGTLVESAGMTWIWFPLENGNPLSKARDSEVAAMLGAVRRILDAGGRVLIHCSAGIHRTGMITYALLRWMGADDASARQTLHMLREITGDGVGERRIAWVHELLLRVRGKPEDHDDKSSSGGGEAKHSRRSREDRDRAGASREGKGRVASRNFSTPAWSDEE